MENTSIDVPAEKVKELVPQTVFVWIRQVNEVENSKKIPHAKREDKKYVNKRTTKYLKMQEEELPHSMWTLGKTLLLYCIVQFLQNSNLETITGIINQLYSKLQEINGVGLNN